VPVSCGWSDVGSWHAVWELSDKDGQGNAAQGTAVFEDSRNCNVSTDKALVALEGVDDLVVVATQDAVLVSRQKDANGLKRLVARLKAVAPEVTEDHIKVHRPWGSYQSVDNGDRHQVKRITVKSGERLSLPLEVTVRDNGAGVPADLLPYIFDPFVTTKQTGSGLGLALVARQTELHSGTASLDASPLGCSSCSCGCPAWSRAGTNRRPDAGTSPRSVVTGHDSGRPTGEIAADTAHREP